MRGLENEFFRGELRVSTGETAEWSREILQIISEGQKGKFLSGRSLKQYILPPLQLVRGMRSTPASTGRFGQSAQALLAKTEKFLQRKRATQLDVNSTHAHLHLRRHFHQFQSQGACGGPRQFGALTPEGPHPFHQHISKGGKPQP